MIYNGRECEFRTLPPKAYGSHVALTIEIVENGVFRDAVRRSASLDKLRGQADTNQTSIAVERDAELAEMMTQAEQRFRDIVDAES